MIGRKKTQKTQKGSGSNLDLIRPLIIGDSQRTTSQTFNVINPYTRTPMAQVCLADTAIVREAIDVADRTFAQTHAQPAHARATLLHKAAAEIARRKAEFADLIVREAGKPITYAEAEVDRAVITFTACAEESRHTQGGLLDADAFAPGEGYSALVRRFPVGVVCGIAPFNFPLNLVAHKVAPVLATGNTMVLKPSPRTPLCSLLLVQVLLECGMIPGQVNVINCSNEDTVQMIRDPRVRHMSFTGSAAVGWELRKQLACAGVTLELGGNAAVIVHSDADLDTVVPAIASAAFGYAGQSCISVQRVFVQATVYEEFKNRLIARTRDKVHTGDPHKREVINGPLIDPASMERVQGAIEKVHASVLIGGEIAGTCYMPTIVENPPPDSTVNVDEIFAPVMTLQPYNDFDDAIRAVNSSRFGIHAGVFTHDIRLAMRAFEQLEVGGVVINQVPTFRLDNAPYGGVKQSGIGREGVRSAMEAITEPKVLILRS